MRHLAVMTVAALFVLAGCTQPPSDVALTSEAPTTPSSEPAASPTTVPAESETSEPAPRSEPPTPVPTETERPAAAGPEVELWFTRDTRGGVYIEPVRYRLPEATAGVAKATIELLVATKPDDPGLSNGLPQGTRVLDVALRDGMLTVDLDFPTDGIPLGAGYESAGYGQIVHTGAQFPTVTRVRILEEGGEPSSGHYLDLDKPTRPQERAISPVVIMTPAHGSSIEPGSVTVSGNANVYEANVLLRLIDPDGKTVEKTFTTATCGTGCRGTWEHAFDEVTTPGTWTVIAGASDPSDGEGNPPYKVRRTFTIP